MDKYEITIDQLYKFIIQASLATLDNCAKDKSLGLLMGLLENIANSASYKLIKIKEEQK